VFVIRHVHWTDSHENFIWRYHLCPWKCSLDGCLNETAVLISWGILKLYVGACHKTCILNWLAWEFHMEISLIFMERLIWRLCKWFLNLISISYLIYRVLCFDHDTCYLDKCNKWADIGCNINYMKVFEWSIEDSSPFMN